MDRMFHHQPVANNGRIKRKKQEALRALNFEAASGLKLFSVYLPQDTQACSVHVEQILELAHVPRLIGQLQFRIGDQAA